MNIDQAKDAIIQALTTKPKREKINNTQLLADTGLRIIHVRKNGRNHLDCNGTRDMTIAFREGNNVIEIATAVVHPHDCFSRKMGTKLAVESFLAGRVVRIPKTIDPYNYAPTPKLASALRTLQLMFR